MPAEWKLSPNDGTLSPAPSAPSLRSRDPQRRHRIGDINPRCFREDARTWAPNVPPKEPTRVGTTQVRGAEFQGIDCRDGADAAHADASRRRGYVRRS